jgi:AraC-like DNA-binding protein
MGLFDSGMQLVSEQQYLTDKDASANELIGFLTQQTEALVNKAGMTLDQVRGIGAAFPSSVDFKRGVTLDMAAAYVGMSASYFSKFFKKYMGVNFITYVTDRKIEAAKDMLVNTDRPVVNIAYDLSYSETNYFSKTFKKKVGVTPTEYREQHLHGQTVKIGG